VNRLKIGLSNFKPVYLKESDRYLHGLVLGSTGAGKSSLFLNFWDWDRYNRTAKVLIESSGFLAREAYNLTGGLYLHLDHPIGINPMMLPFDPHQIASNVVQIIDQLVAGTNTANLNLTSNMKRLVNEGVLYCLNRNRPRLDALVDWLKSQRGNQEAREGITNRLEMILGNPKMRTILCTEETIDWDDFTEKRGILDVDGQGMSDEELVMTGTTITHGIKSYLQFTRKKEYKPLAIYVDECHKFTNPNWYDILKQGRKYKLAGMFATQDFASIPEQMARVMLSNCGTLIAFRCGSREAQMLSKEFKSLNQEEIQFLDKYHAAYRTPEGEGILKTSRPPLVKERTLYQKPKPTGWFPLRPTVHEA
jgi:type IV secretory pathway VirB4 component